MTSSRSTCPRFNYPDNAIPGAHQPPRKPGRFSSRTSPYDGKTRSLELLDATNPRRSHTSPPTSASSADNSDGPAVYRAQRPPSWPSLDLSTTGVRPLSCAWGTHAPIYAPASPSWGVREIANAEVRGLTAEGFGTDFARSWNVFCLGSGKAQVRGMICICTPGASESAASRASRRHQTGVSDRCVASAEESEWNAGVNRARRPTAPHPAQSVPGHPSPNPQPHSQDPRSTRQQLT